MKKKKKLLNSLNWLILDLLELFFLHTKKLSKTIWDQKEPQISFELNLIKFILKGVS